MDAWKVGEAACEVSSLLSADTARGLLGAMDEMTSGAALRYAVRSQVPADVQPLVEALFASCDGSVHAFTASLASAVTTRSRLELEHGKAEIVWTGPATLPVPNHRPTAAVAHELIATAKEHLTLATYSAGKVEDLIDALDKRRKQGTDIRLLLETPKSDGSGPDCPKAFERLVPYVTALEWPRRERQDYDWTSMHVKVLVRDGDAALVTSANMSRSAMRDNMELGVLMDGGPIPARLKQHFDDLQDAGFLVALT
jgi:phosphatidylserine/phosphatidylglycerophosphate/cardiolipin synthase-like enzyme